MTLFLLVVLFTCLLDLVQGSEKIQDLFSHDKVALSLRLTCEINQNLQIKSNDDDEELTLFHSKSPKQRSKKIKRGCERWGPNLQTFLDELDKVLQFPSEMVLPLTLLFLDRACSLKTDRSYYIPLYNNALQRQQLVRGKYSACPWLLPRTVHRLVLTAVLVACKTCDEALFNNNNNNDDISSYEEKLAQSFGLTIGAVKAMEEYFINALGLEGQCVSQGQFDEWVHIWRQSMTNEQDDDDSNNDRDDSVVSSLREKPYNHHYHQQVTEEQPYYSSSVTGSASSDEDFREGQIPEMPYSHPESQLRMIGSTHHHYNDSGYSQSMTFVSR